MTFRRDLRNTDLKRIKAFYTEIVGLNIPDSFEDHNGFSDVFRWTEKSNWELEFTSSGISPSQSFGQDDILVIYVNSTIELEQYKQELLNKKINLLTPVNPYWAQNGVMFADPDNHKVIFALREVPLNAKDELTKMAQKKNIYTWSHLLEHVRHLPYGRNSNRHDPALVMTESIGTCSSKHALLKELADRNHVDNVELVLGIYKMDRANTPKIGPTLEDNGLQLIPEAHCYLSIAGKRFDLTSPSSDIERIRADLLEERTINASQVSAFKVEYHKEFLKNWLNEQSIALDFETIWAIREKCIEKLGSV